MTQVQGSGHGSSNSKYVHFLVGAGQAGQDHGQTKGLAARLSRPKRPLPNDPARRRGEKAACFALNQAAPSRPYVIFRIAGKRNDRIDIFIEMKADAVTHFCG